MKAVIIFYSRSGTTRRLAERIQGVFGGELAELKAAEPYGGYLASVKRYGRERKSGTVPDYEIPKLDLTDVDTVFVGYPVWYSEAPSFLREYLAQLSLKGKTVIPFSTSGASSIKPTLKGLKEAVGQADLKHPYSQGLLVKDDFDKWVKEVSAG